MRLLEEGAQALGLSLTSRHLTAFRIYFRELAEWNLKFNLTALTSYEDVQVKHFLDSLTCLLALPTPGVESYDRLPDVVPISTREAPLLCIDVGTGAGLPGLPVKILRPTLHMTLLDSSRKKVSFLQHLVECLELEGVESFWARAEDLGRDPHHRERYDVVLARAVADMSVLVELCLPLCRVGGRFVAQKGSDIGQELGRAGPAIGLLGGQLRDVRPLHLPGLRDPRTLIVVEKVGETPSSYPRRAGIPAKRPLTAR